jgi:hypothetical protein
MQEVLTKLGFTKETDITFSKEQGILTVYLYLFPDPPGRGRIDHMVHASLGTGFARTLRHGTDTFKTEEDVVKVIQGVFDKIKADADKEMNWYSKIAADAYQYKDGADYAIAKAGAAIIALNPEAGISFNNIVASGMTGEVPIRKELIKGSHKPSVVLQFLFNWHYTPEKYRYWNGICTLLRLQESSDA